MTQYLSKWIYGGVVIALAAMFMVSCGDDDEPSTTTPDTDESEAFDREAMLTFWADDIIMPAYRQYLTQLTSLQVAQEAYAADVDTTNLNTLRQRWRDAIMAWQQVALFEIGPAESRALRGFSNTFPVDGESIEGNIANGNYNLELPSTRNQQGLGALDYLLYGVADNTADIVAVHSQEGYSDYMSEIVNRLVTLTTETLEAWEGSYRDEFISNSGSSATASVDKMVNDYLFHYEKFFRAGKVGIPAGVFSNNPIPTSVEAVYAGDMSKALFEVSLETLKNFFDGVSFDGTAQGASLADYIDHVEDTSNSQNALSSRIGAQFNIVEQELATIDDSFRQQIESDNTAMLNFYDEVQALVPLFKSEMMSTLSIQVDFVDADGD